MGGWCCLGRRATRGAGSDAGPMRPQLKHFSIVRSIGRGAFGKVCIVQQRSTKKFFALKYMRKQRCVDKNVAENVLRELRLLAACQHPFIVNLWYTFQDHDYMYMVSDLLLGGDLRFHLNQQGRFAEDRTKLYLCEVALALGYLHDKGVVHRDVKPENIILDESGHARLADFNLATRLETGTVATSFSGTRPYMAPEIYETAVGDRDGYDERVDWWSLGVCVYEMLRGRTPYEFHGAHAPEQALHILRDSQVAFPSGWPSDLSSFLKHMLAVHPSRRFDSLDAVKKHDYLARIEWQRVMNRRTAPVFVPCKEGFNCDPMYELEERIVVSTPIHHRRKRSKHQEQEDERLRDISTAFVDYSREIDGVAADI